jgi:hypothetical protein
MQLAIDAGCAVRLRRKQRTTAPEPTRNSGRNFNGNRYSYGRSDFASGADHVECNSLKIKRGRWGADALISPWPRRFGSEDPCNFEASGRL